MLAVRIYGVWKNDWCESGMWGTREEHFQGLEQGKEKTHVVIENIEIEILGIFLYMKLIEWCSVYWKKGMSKYFVPVHFWFKTSI